MYLHIWFDSFCVVKVWGKRGRLRKLPSSTQHLN